MCLTCACQSWRYAACPLLTQCLSPWCAQLLIEQRNYANITTYVFKADAALDASSANAGPADSSAGAPAAAAAAAPSRKKSAEREQIQSKLDLATAFSHLGQGSYDKAAQMFTKVGSPKDLGEWIGKVSSRWPIKMMMCCADSRRSAGRTCRYRDLRHSMCVGDVAAVVA